MRIKILLIVSLLFTLSRCVTHEYDVFVSNSGPSTISEADVLFNGFRSGGGWIEPGLFKVHAGVTHAIPERATVRWRTADGVLHEVAVEVRSALPNGYRGNIGFIIQADNTVRVGFDAPDAKPR